MASKIRSILKIKNSQTGGGFIAWFFVIIVLLGAALVFLVMNKVWGDVSPQLGSALNDSIPISDRQGVSEALNDTSSGVSLFDKLLPFLIIGLFAFVFIIAGTIIDSPVMLFVGIIIMAVVVLLGVIYSNIYNDISTSSEFISTNSQLPITNLFMQYLPVIGFLMAIGIGIAVIIRRGGVSGGRY